MKPEPTVPDAVSRLFPGRSGHICAYADLLAGEAVARGLLGPREASRLWERHILNCGVVAPLFRSGTTLADVGSGAGLPGLVLAIARPDVRVTLIEPLLRRFTFLTEVADRLELTVEVVRARAEELHRKRRFDYVTARAVAPLGRLAALSLPLCAEGGEVVAWKGSSAAEEVSAARSALQEYKAASVVIEHYGAGVVTPPATVVRIQSP
ncbi:MAG TPA: 16S rRNA (guanine(527)-N(7))-methyltransferase RsmG [Pseudonocardiaceae bacterium]|nr:16S rRNA (guanine(527)-N(7))-methyltransferase RsmG [Pseudonocardiaceae bacterium]